MITVVPVLMFAALRAIFTAKIGFESYGASFRGGLRGTVRTLIMNYSMNVLFGASSTSVVCRVPCAVVHSTLYRTTKSYKVEAIWLTTRRVTVVMVAN